jgi:hypothetical protein
MCATCRQSAATPSASAAEAWLDHRLDPQQTASLLVEAFFTAVEKAAGAECPAGEQTHVDAATAVDLDGDGVPLSFQSAVRGPDGPQWLAALETEWRRLIDDTGCVRFEGPDAKPPGRTATYFNPRVRVKFKNGVKVHRVRGTAGGDKLPYEGNVSAETASIPLIKIFWHAVVSEHKHWATLDIKDFYLGTPMAQDEWLRVPLRLIPPAVQRDYNVQALQRDGFVYVRVMKGIYGLPQAGLLARERLVKHLHGHGYCEAAATPSLFRHKTRDIAFVLVVDDFGVKYANKADMDHLITVLRELYQLTVSWDGEKYVGFKVQHDYVASTIRVSIPGYVEQMGRRFGVRPPTRPVDAPLAYVPPTFGRRGPQWEAPSDTTTALSPNETSRIRQIIGVALFYARAVDPLLLLAINKIATCMAAPTRDTMRATERLMAYMATHPDGSVNFRPSDMQLHAHTDASFCSEREARSRAAAVHWIGNKADEKLHNAVIEVTTKIITTVCASTAEAEYVAVYSGMQTAESLRNALHDLGYAQGATVVTVDNMCAKGIAHKTVTMKRTKAILLRYHWVRERVELGHFKIVWAPSEDNLADTFTKPLPAYRLKERRPLYVQG